MPNNHGDIILSEADREIVGTLDRDALIVANAGAGKTTLLVEHYFELLAQGFEPSGVIAFTFTEKAAGEMKTRIMERFSTHPHFAELPADLLQDFRHRTWNAPIGTIHQFCLKLITESQSNAGGRLKIIEEGSEAQLQERIAHRQLSERLRREDPPALLLLATFGIQVLKRLLKGYLAASQNLHAEETGLPPCEAREEELLAALQDLAAPIQEELEMEKRRLSWIQFDDMERQALRLLKDPTPHLQRHLKIYTHALLDEFQDTSPIQIEIVETLRRAVNKAGRPFHVFYVGDPKQSIYRFRKVDRNLIMKSERALLERGGRRFESVRNFRSRPPILRFVNAFAAGAFPESAPSQDVIPETSGSKVRLVTVPLSEEKILAEDYRLAEAALVASTIEELGKKGERWADIAVLARYSASFPLLAAELKARGIPFALRGGQELLDRQEVLDLIRLLSFLHKPQDNLSLIGVLRSPLFLISDATFFFLREKVPEGALWDYLKLRSFPEDFQDPNLPDLPKLAWSVGILEILLEGARLESPSRLLRHFLNYFEIPELVAGAETDADSALTIPQFLEFLAQLEDENQTASLGEVLAILKNLRRLSAHKTPLGNLIESKDCVPLMTIHAAKGLEFDTVFLLDLERQGPVSGPKLQHWGEQFALKYPSEDGSEEIESPRYQAIRSYHKDEEKEENKRLLYVAMTRAKKNLIITLHPQPRKKDNLQGLLKECLGERATEWTEASGKQPAVLESPQPAPAATLLEILEAPTFPRGPAAREFTVSEVETFQVCPLKHHYLSQCQIPDSTWRDPWDLDPSEMGTLLHAALRWLAVHPERAPREALEAVYRERPHWPKEEIFLTLDQTLAAYRNSPAWRKLAAAEEDHSELPFLLQLKPGRIRGQIDRLARLKTGGWLLVDFKYVTRRTSDAEIKEAYGFQLKTYSLAAKKFLGVAPGIVQIHLLGGNKVIDFSFSKGELGAHQEQLEEIVTKMHRPELEAVERNPGCFSCAFHERIPLCGVPSGIAWGERPPLFF